MRPTAYSIPRRPAAATRHVRLTLVTWLSAAIRLPVGRRTCTPGVVWQVLLWAAAFTRSVAVEVAGANVFVNAIAAGGILTPPMEAYLAGCSEEQRNRLHQLVPLGRLGKPEEYASLAVYLASDEHYLVGQTISPNGGMVL